MTENRDTLEKPERFLLRGLRIGASTVLIVELLRNDWTGGISAGGLAGVSAGGAASEECSAARRSLLLNASALAPHPLVETGN